MHKLLPSYTPRDIEQDALQYYEIVCEMYSIYSAIDGLLMLLEDGNTM